MARTLHPLASVAPRRRTTTELLMIAHELSSASSTGRPVEGEAHINPVQLYKPCAISNTELLMPKKTASSWRGTQPPGLQAFGLPSMHSSIAADIHHLRL